MKNYSWPGMFKPFEHQITTSQFLISNNKAFCFNEAGTGKTSSVIWAVDYLMDLGLIKRVLIVCPLSIMYSAWQADLFKTAMHRTAGVAYGSRSKREKVIHGGYDFVIINYDGVGIVKEDIKAAEFDLIVIDEANAYKTSTTRRWKIMKSLIYPSTGVWMLTGTPASQSPLDAYGLAKLVNPNGVPKFFSAWRDKVMFPVSRFKWAPKPGSRELVFETLQPAIRFTKEECLDLPDVMYQYRSASMTSQQQKFYKILKEDLLIKAAGEEVSAVNAAAKLSKLLQLSGGAVYTDTGEVLEFDVKPRLDILNEILEEASHKVIVFVPFKHTIRIVNEHIKKGGYTTEIINGETSAFNRGENI
jgi:SNF2 family DNA or RNA helicase